MNKPETVEGPLAAYAAGFTEHLAELGYGEASVDRHLQRLRTLNAFLERETLEPSQLDEAVIRHFLACEGATPQSYRRLLAFLRSTGVVPCPAEAPVSAVADILADYRCWLVRERSLSPSTVNGYMSGAKWLVLEYLGGDRQRLLSLDAAGASAAVLQLAKPYSPRTVNEFVVQLRSFFKYLYSKGLIETPLHQATPWMAQGRSSSLPRTLKAGIPEQLLASCDLGHLAGVRDYAVLKVLIRLGLRRAEVAALSLDDFDWRHGEVTVPGKGGFRDPLPIPVDVGEAIAAYLAKRGRDDSTRSLFSHVKAPRGPITPTDVSAIVQRACERADVMDTGTHRLRHAVATEMLKKGAPLYEIGQVLRHRDLETTSMYAKVDLGALSSVARPWPGTAK